MYCNNCRYKNSKDALFCENCGTKLAKDCPHCKASNKLHALYCKCCGNKFKAPSIYSLSLVQEVNNLTSHLFHPVNTEYQQLTILFCDLVGFTRISETISPKNLHQVIRAYQTTATRVITQFGGYIAQYLGDGILVYFGYPNGQEHNTCRAIGASLEIVKSIKVLNQSLIKDYGLSLTLRQGIHTGPVVIGELGGNGKTTKLAFGHPVNVASRLQDLAPPDQVLISKDTYQLSKAFFNAQSKGYRKLKNISQPMEVFQVKGYKNTNGEAGTSLKATWYQKSENGEL